MILGYTKTEDLPATTLDEVFRRAATRRPGAFALADPTNRDSFTDGPPRHLTYAEADRVVSAIASRLRTLGLQTDAIIGIQLPNAVESVLTTLGVLRAGLIAVQVAADIFPISHVCSFGPSLPDGLIALDDLLHGAPELPPEIERDGNPAAHVAVVTFDVTPDGLVAVARNHAELIAGWPCHPARRPHRAGRSPARLLRRGLVCGARADHDALAAQQRYAAAASRLRSRRVRRAMPRTWPPMPWSCRANWCRNWRRPDCWLTAD